jgi:hypothetical protein
VGRVGRAKSGSKAFGELLCSQPKAKRSPNTRDECILHDNLAFHCCGESHSLILASNLMYVTQPLALNIHPNSKTCITKSDSQKYKSIQELLQSQDEQTIYRKTGCLPGICSPTQIGLQAQSKISILES